LILLYVIPSQLKPWFAETIKVILFILSPK
jgi:hypothetical protein